MMICQTCKQPITGCAFTACVAPNGATWYLHYWLGDCVRALLAAGRREASVRHAA